MALTRRCSMCRRPLDDEPSPCEDCMAPLYQELAARDAEQLPSPLPRAVPMRRIIERIGDEDVPIYVPADEVRP